ncbi:unnamed protein product [Orchesella dallaii]|uniref:Uncharacterized protein n=1 Tax=Orchesella dallaii TaxID=48710 RepID=A0ABP1R4F4_9HEXA
MELQLANMREDSKNKELLLESARQYKACSMKQIATAKAEVTLARSLHETSVQARNKMRSELCKKLKSVEKELKAAKKKIESGNTQLKQQHLRIQSSEKEISELAAKNVKNNEVIQDLQEKNGELNQFVDNVKNAMQMLCLRRGTMMQNNA